VQLSEIIVTDCTRRVPPVAEDEPYVLPDVDPAPPAVEPLLVPLVEPLLLVPLVVPEVEPVPEPVVPVLEPEDDPLSSVPVTWILWPT
jgi:hypothetical protein